MGEHKISRVSWAALLATGLSLSVLAGYAADRYWQDRLLRDFNARVADVFDLTEQRLAEYETMLKTAMSQYESNRILAKDGFGQYLKRLRLLNYPGLAELNLRNPSAAPKLPPFDEEWGKLDAPGAGDGKVGLLWHVPLYPITAAPDAPVAEAVEARFDLPKLFGHVFEKVRLGRLRARVFVEGEHVFQGYRLEPVYASDPSGDGPVGPLWSDISIPFAAVGLRVFLYDRPSLWESHGPGIAVAGLGGLLIVWLVWAVRTQHQASLREQQRQHQQDMARYERAEAMAFIAHELAQPLSGVLGCIEGPLTWLERGQVPVDILLRDLRQAQAQASRACDCLDEIRGQIGQGGRAKLQPVALDEILQRLADWARGDASLQGISLRLGIETPGLRVLANPLSLELVLRNLLRNAAEAIRGSGKGGRVWLDTGLAGNEVKIRVADDGPGLAEPSALFTPFKTGKPQGMGMGLVYCERRVKDFGGGIQGGNRPEGGAWFEIVLSRLTE